MLTLLLLLLTLSVLLDLAAAANDNDVPRHGNLALVAIATGRDLAPLSIAKATIAIEVRRVPKTSRKERA
jgi:hypothetical protein